MEKKYIALVFIVLGILYSCDEQITSSCNEGNGQITTQDRGVADFTSIILKGSANVYITIADEYKVEIETDSNLQKNYRAYKEGNSLIIDNDDNLCPSLLAVRVSLKELKALDLMGAGNIILLSDMYCIKFSAVISGSGNIDFRSVEADSFSVSATGSGNINAEGGRAYNSEMNIYGAGNINLLDLMAESVNANIAGSGNIKTWVLSNLYARISGSGNIIYKGAPVIDSEITGSGKLISY